MGNTFPLRSGLAGDEVWGRGRRITGAFLSNTDRVPFPISPVEACSSELTKLWGGSAMPWKECSVMDERLARRIAGEPMAELCREFGISRKTGYKIFDRYQECRLHGLSDRSRRPYRYANQLPF